MSFQHQGSGNQTSPPVYGTDCVLHRDVMCYNCDRPGHFSVQCSSHDHRNIRTQSFRLGYSFYRTTPVQKDLINLNCILLDSCSIVSSVMNTSLLSDTKDCHPETAILMFTNGGNTDYKQSVTIYLLPLNFSTTHISLPTSWHSLVLPFNSE